jgi:hypothetical protein
VPYAQEAVPPLVHRVSANPAVFVFRPNRRNPVHRWDDPWGEYGVLYTSATEKGSLIETIGDFRRSLDMLAALQSIDVDDDTTASVTPLKDTIVGSGTIGRRYLESLYIGAAVTVSGRAVNVTHSESLAEIRIDLASYLVGREFTDLGTDLILARDRKLTQYVSRLAYTDPQEFDAIRCESYYGLDIVN